MKDLAANPLDYAESKYAESASRSFLRSWIPLIRTCPLSKSAAAR